VRPVLIFDLDGTLVDSKKDLTASVNHIRLEFDLPILTEDEIARFIGNGALMLIRRALGPKATEENIQTRLYPGVRESLDRLRETARLAVLTNKPVHFSCAMLDGLGIYKHFVSVYGGNSFDQKKPDPVGVFQILSDTNGHRDRTWMIGDSGVDVLTGRNATITTCGVTYGYAAETFKDVQPDFLIDSFSELEPLIHDSESARSVPRS
jgi:phosphoglycolate phosphatase